MNARIILVETLAGSRELVRELLEKMGLSVIAETGEGKQACELILQHKPDLVILDLDLPGLNGFDVVDHVRAKGFNGPVLTLTGEQRPYPVQRIHEMNFAGAISKKAKISEWREGILEVLAGKIYRCPHFTQWRTTQVLDPLAPSKLLTERETEILSLIGLVKSNDEIAEIFGISSCTVQGFRSNLINKLRVHSTPNLVRFSQEKGYASFKRLIPTKARQLAALSLIASLPWADWDQVLFFYA